MQVSGQVNIIHLVERGSTGPVGDIIVISLVNYCPSKAGQPLVNKLLMHHGLPTPMDAWSQEKTRKADNVIAQDKEKKKKIINTPYFNMEH